MEKERNNERLKELQLLFNDNLPRIDKETEKGRHDDVAYLCRRLLNSGRIVVGPTLTLPVLGQMLSDAMLGPNYPHEIKC